MQQTKRTRWPRLLCLLLSLCMIVGMLPTPAYAAGTQDEPALIANLPSEPTSWPAPDSQYTTPGQNPVYLYLDFSDDGSGIAGSHNCTEGSEFIQDIVKATATTGGHVKLICSGCGSWAQIDVPALPLSAFELDPSCQSMVDNGVEFSGEPYSVLYNVAAAYQRFVGNKLDNHVSVSNVGNYNIQITLNSTIYDNVQHITNEMLRVYPKGVPWMDIFSSRPYDGTNYMTGKSVSYTDVKGQSVNVGLSVMLLAPNISLHKS